MDFPLTDLMDQDACYRKIVGLLHPGGLTCPVCRSSDRLRVHRRHRAPVLDYRCTACGRVFNAFTGTDLDGTHRPGIATADQVQGKELSFNNLNDTDAAFEAVAEFEERLVDVGGARGVGDGVDAAHGAGQRAGGVVLRRVALVGGRGPDMAVGGVVLVGEEPTGR